MTGIVEAADKRIALDRAIADVADAQKKRRKEATAKAANALIEQVSALFEQVSQGRLDVTAREGSPPLPRWLWFLPGHSTLSETKGGRAGWPIAEVNVVIRLRLWRRVVRRFKIGQDRARRASVRGAQGVLLLNTGELHEYFWLESSNWVAIGREYDAASPLPSFEIPSGLGGLFSKFPPKPVDDTRWAASLQAGMFALVHAARKAGTAGPGGH